MNLSSDNRVINITSPLVESLSENEWGIDNPEYPPVNFGVTWNTTKAVHNEVLKILKFSNRAEDIIREVFSELESLQQEDGDEQITPPSSLVIENAKKFVREICLVSPNELSVGIYDDGSVSLTRFGKDDRSLMLVFKPDGSFLISLIMEDNYCRMWCSNVDFNSACFLNESIKRLEESG